MAIRIVGLTRGVGGFVPLPDYTVQLPGGETLSSGDGLRHRLYGEVDARVLFYRDSTGRLWIEFGNPNEYATRQYASHILDCIANGTYTVIH